MSLFVCPVCKNILCEEERLYKCGKGHCYDKSKFGYVNLLQSQKSSSKRHGDDRLMIRARRDFLSKGYYGLLLENLSELCSEYLDDGFIVLDAGCGECYYSSEIKQSLAEKGKSVEFYGVDISKDALEFASKRRSSISLAVASLFDLPFADGSFDALFNIFSPEADAEFSRVLKNGGLMFRVIPLEKHLYGLKEAIYDKPYLNDVPDTQTDGFVLLKSKQVKGRVQLESNEDIQNLFKMTPYYYKTGKSDQQKIENLQPFSTEFEFEIRIYRKES